MLISFLIKDTQPIIQIWIEVGEYYVVVVIVIIIKFILSSYHHNHNYKTH